MKCTSRVRINQMAMKRLSDAAAVSLEQTAEALHTEVVQAQVVPRMDGTLQGEAFFVDTAGSPAGKVSLVHSMPYARRLYFHPEYHFHKTPWEETVHRKDGSVTHQKHDGNPNAKGKWFDDWKEGGKKGGFAPETFKKFYRRNSGL